MLRLPQDSDLGRNKEAKFRAQMTADDFGEDGQVAGRRTAGNVQLFTSITSKYLLAL